MREEPTGPSHGQSHALVGSEAHSPASPDRETSLPPVGNVPSRSAPTREETPLATGSLPFALASQSELLLPSHQESLLVTLRQVAAQLSECEKRYMTQQGLMLDQQRMIMDQQRLRVAQMAAIDERLGRLETQLAATLDEIAGRAGTSGAGTGSHLSTEPVSEAGHGR